MTDTNVAAPGEASTPVTLPTHESTPAEIIFKPEITYREDLRPGLDTLRDLGATPEQVAEHTTSMAEAFANAGFSSSEVRDLHGLLVAAQKSPPTSDDLRAWELESRKLLREQYRDEADARIARAREYVAAHPRLHKLLSSGAGSHPRVVAALAANAYQLRIPAKKK